MIEAKDSYEVKPQIINPKDWGKNITGRLVVFPRENNLINWGIEVDVPITKKMRLALKDVQIKVPERIRTLKYVTFDPQSSLPFKERNIRHPKDKDLFHLSTLQLITDINILYSQPIQNVVSIILDIARDIPTRYQLSNDLKIAAESRQSHTLLIIDGHGFGDPHQIGEHNDGVDDKYKNIQFPGNYISTQQLINKYSTNQNSSKDWYPPAAILIPTCNRCGASFESTGQVPVYYVGKGIIFQNTFSESGKYDPTSRIWVRRAPPK